VNYFRLPIALLSLTQVLWYHSTHRSRCEFSFASCGPAILTKTGRLENLCIYVLDRMGISRILFSFPKRRLKPNLGLDIKMMHIFFIYIIQRTFKENTKIILKSPHYDSCRITYKFDQGGNHARGDEIFFGCIVLLTY
jgi:hypothetical protein